MPGRKPAAGRARRARGARSSRSARPDHAARPKKARTSVEVRRTRLALGAAVAFSALILAAWFPASELLSQHEALAATNAQLHQLQAQDRALSQEDQRLSTPAEIERIARQQLQLVAPGERAYEVLPANGATTNGTVDPGDPGLQAPVAPSAQSELPPGTAVAPTSARSSHHRTAKRSDPGLLTRIARTLEFWR
jgi:cell division protein FtsB